MKHSSFSAAKLVGNIRQHATQNLIAAPNLKAPMHSFVVRVPLRQHVPLRAPVLRILRTRFKPQNASESVCAQDVHPQYSPPESDPGCVPTARPLAESFDIWIDSSLQF
jgi:hypothetical protein